ncbi:hypothetical protein [Algoriphagus aquimarinus]|uniref:Uncharacterized protein n=1 Tax=Algoriphagus aquimarinus TaxID=237018 RepID=A0A1I1BKF7_9BACT|nr:hypothetical protein [Algoriphagus aquimarinus]SFB50617.1 hypothetical protein SAMN04489723_11486 [Algoriphagus aquimarinus]
MKNLLFIVLLFTSISSFAQKRRFQYMQKIPLQYLVVDSYTIKNGDTLFLPTGSTIEEVKEVEKGGRKITFTSLKTLSANDTTTFDKIKSYDRRLSGRANVYVKEDEYSKIFIDYWLTTKTYFPTGTILNYYFEDEKVAVEKLEKSKGLNYYTVPSDIYEIVEKLPERIDSLKNKLDSVSSLRYNGIKQENYIEAKKIFEANKKAKIGVNEVKSKVYALTFANALRKKENSLEQELKSIYTNKQNKNFLWAAYAKEKIVVPGDKPDESTIYFKKYPENSFIKLENREYIKLNFAAWEMAALTIPIKYRPGISKNSSKVPSQAATEFNVSTYIGRTWGRLKYKNQAFEKIKPAGQAFSVGGFLGFNVVELDSTSTSLKAEKALKEKETIVALSSGAGIVYNIMDFDFGLFLGWDIGFGETGRKWNYSGRHWIGFGLGYNISMLGKKED